MTYLPVDSIEIEDNSHPDEYDHSTLSGNTECKKML